MFIIIIITSGPVQVEITTQEYGKPTSLMPFSIQNYSVYPLHTCNVIS